MRILEEELDKPGWAESEVAWRARGDARKIRIAQRLRIETAVTLKWIAVQLRMVTWTRVANRLRATKNKSQPENQNELRLV